MTGVVLLQGGGTAPAGVETAVRAGDAEVTGVCFGIGLDCKSARMSVGWLALHAALSLARNTKVWYTAPACRGAYFGLTQVVVGVLTCALGNPYTPHSLFVAGELPGGIEHVWRVG